MSEPTPGALSAGQIFHGRYEIVRCLKAGGMGAVYECIHLKTRKRRALKVMLPQILAEAGMRERFELEARVTAEIESEHIIETFDAGVDDATGAPFLVMELLRGEDLASILKKRGPLPADETVLLLAQAALALDKTHAAGIVHRDLKPDNLYVTRRDDGSPRLKILDFGIAKVVADGNQSVQSTATLGTPLYMSREQILGEGTVGPAADVYAMGHIAFALLAGEAYWMDEHQAYPAAFIFMGKVMSGASEPATARAARRGVTLPSAFDAWFAQATAKSASDRFEDTSTLVRELAVALGVPVPKIVSVPVVLPDPRVPAPSLAGSTTLFAPRGSPAELSGGAAPTVSGGTTVVASSTSIESLSRPPRAHAAVMGLGALGVIGIGLLVMALDSPSPGPGAVPTLTIGAPADTPIAAPSAPEPAPVSTPSVAPAPSSSTGAAPAIARPAQDPPRARPAPARPVAPANPCNPPYVINSAGHRVIKLQCR